MGPANFCTTPEFGSSSGRMSKTRAVWFFIAALTLIRLSMLGSTDLEFDEAHYWMWSERLAPGYFSKGPGIAFAIRASTMLFGPTEFGVRFWSPILAAGTRSEEHTSELQSRVDLVCRLLLEKKNIHGVLHVA